MYRVFCSNQNKSLQTVEEYKKNANFLKFLQVIYPGDKRCRDKRKDKNTGETGKTREQERLERLQTGGTVGIGETGETGET